MKYRSPTTWSSDSTTTRSPVRKDAKAYTLRRTKKSAVINSSLWGAIMEQQLPYALAAELEDIYQWTVDFFGIQKGDDFTVIYDERFIDDTVSVGIGRIWGAKVLAGRQGVLRHPVPPRAAKSSTGEADGASLRSRCSKAPLKYSRISSKFSYARKHPIYKVYRPHTGVDYAAPKGTPVHAVADGTVTFKGWGGGGGNTLKIKHAGNLMTGYLHLSGYAKGIVKGSRVSQGSADRLRRFDGRIDRPAPRLPRLEERHADRPAEDSVGTRRADRQGEPRAVRIRPRPHHG